MGKDKERPLCKWDKDEIKERWDDVVAMVRTPKYACRRCGRAVAEKDQVCKAEKLH